MERGYFFYLADKEKKNEYIENNKQDDTFTQILSIIREYADIKKIPDEEINRYFDYLAKLSHDAKGQYPQLARNYRYVFGKCTRTRRFQYLEQDRSCPYNIKCLSDLENAIASGKYITEGEGGEEYDLFSFRCADYEYIHHHPMYNDPVLDTIEQLETPSLNTEVGKLFKSTRLVLSLRRRGYETVGDIVKTSFLEFWENTDLPEPNYEEIKKVLFAYGLLR